MKTIKVDEFLGNPVIKRNLEALNSFPYSISFEKYKAIIDEGYNPYQVYSKDFEHISPLFESIKSDFEVPLSIYQKPVFPGHYRTIGVEKPNSCVVSYKLEEILLYKYYCIYPVLTLDNFHIDGLSTSGYGTEFGLSDFASVPVHYIEILGFDSLDELGISLRWELNGCHYETYPLFNKMRILQSFETENGVDYDYSDISVLEVKPLLDELYEEYAKGESRFIETIEDYRTIDSKDFLNNSVVNEVFKSMSVDISEDIIPIEDYMSLVYDVPKTPISLYAVDIHSYCTCTHPYVYKDVLPSWSSFEPIPKMVLSNYYFVIPVIGYNKFKVKGKLANLKNDTCSVLFYTVIGTNSIGDIDLVVSDLFNYYANGFHLCYDSAKILETIKSPNLNSDNFNLLDFKVHNISDKMAKRMAELSVKMMENE